MEDIPLLRENAADRVGKNTPHRCPIWGGVDTRGCAAAKTKNTSELPQPKSRVREELQAKLAYHCIETAVLERQCLAVSGHRPKRSSPQPVARSFQHCWRDVRSNHDARSADDREGHQRGFPRSGRDIEHSAPLRHLSSANHCWHEKSGPPAGETVIC